MERAPFYKLTYFDSHTSFFLNFVDGVPFGTFDM